MCFFFFVKQKTAYELRISDWSSDVCSADLEFIANSPVNLDYQNNDAEFANLPGKYAAPKGCVLLADREGEIEGCVAMRQVTHEICEMKRLYVRPQAQGRHLGRALAERLLAEASTEIGRASCRERGCQ